MLIRVRCPVPLLFGLTVDEQQGLFSVDKSVIKFECVAVLNLVVIVEGVGDRKEEGVHAVLSFEHLEMFVLCGDKSR